MRAAIPVELEPLVERLAQERCSHGPIVCQACTNLAVIGVETFVASGWWAQQRRYALRASISAPICLPTSTARLTPDSAPSAA